MPQPFPGTGVSPSATKTVKRSMPIRSLIALALAMIFVTAPALGSVSCEAACSAAAQAHGAGSNSAAPAGGHEHHGGNASEVAGHGKTPVALEVPACPAMQPLALQGRVTGRATPRLFHASLQLAAPQPALAMVMKHGPFQPLFPPGTPAPSSLLTPALRI